MGSTPHPFSAEAWWRNLALYHATLALPFNEEPAEGRLSLDRFRHYVVEDAKYLTAFGQVLAAAAAKSDGPDHIVLFAGAAREAVLVERALHEDCLGRFGLDAAVATEPTSPACHHYACFLLATAFTRAMQLEWTFWDSAHRRERWPA